MPEFRPCIVVPIFNHGAAIGATVARLAVHGHPIFIVDDGSDAATRSVLAGLAERAGLQVLRLDRNGGKGGAVMHGMLHAHAAGFTHALQVDADGQHDADDVPLFLARGRAAPLDVICGQPVYDASVPRARLYGRYITHFWVWVETLSLSIADSMCGFRLYPLAASCQTIREVRLPARMAFDTAIAVRLSWQGLHFQNVRTRVTYPADGLSHFRMLLDNLLISAMHTRLVAGMLLRLPMLLGRKLAARSAPAHWSQLRERGGGVGLRVLSVCHRLLGDAGARLLLYPVVAYFFLSGRTARAASLAYLRRVAVASGRPAASVGLADSFAHMMAFAQSGLDKLSAWTGRIDPASVDFPARAEFDRLLAEGRGALLIGSHLGNLELLRALATREQRASIHAVVYTGNAKRFNAALARQHPAFATRLIEVDAIGPDTAIVLKEKIDSGDMLVIVGDRTPVDGQGASRTVPVEFLGAPAAFAHGPFILASALECPVYLMFCLREGRRHRIHFETFAQRIVLPRAQRQQRLREHVQQYARRLEALCLETPDQWFNFHDLWRLPPPPPFFEHVHTDR